MKKGAGWKVLAVLIAFVIFASGIVVGASSTSGDAEAVVMTSSQNSASYAFEDLGYKTSTYSEHDESVTIDFSSPFVESRGDLNLHLNVLDRGEVEVRINGATLFPSKRFDEGEHRERIDIPTGMIDQGTNTLTISFPSYVYEITLLEDSMINITGTHVTFTYSPENPIIGESITFNASSSYENITKYVWDFGDETNAIGETATHSYSSAGEYNVTLTVTHDEDGTDTISKKVFVGISRWVYDATVKESRKEPKTGVLTMTFRGWEPVGRYYASVFHIANTVPEEPSNYKVILANTGDFMEKYVTEDNRSYFAKLLPINPYEGMNWQDGVSLLTNMSIPNSPAMGHATPYYITGIEDIEVPAGNFSCFHVKARYDMTYAKTTIWRYVDEWWDEEGRGLIQAKYKAGGAYMGEGLMAGSSSTTWEYKLNNFTDSIFPINYMGIENKTLASSYTTDPPKIDGIISAGEWTNEIPITLNGYKNPQSTIKGELYVMNGLNNIYIAVVIPDDNRDADYLLLDFDQGNDHVATDGDEDAIGFDLNSLYPRFPAGYTDLHWDSFIGWWGEDVNVHGYGAQSYEPPHPGIPGKYRYEFVKPLKSGDSQDMALNLGDTIGFRIEVRDGTTDDWYRYPRNTVDGVTSRWYEWADLIVGMP